MTGLREASVTFRLIHGDALVELQRLPSDYFDSVVTDPPYGLEFMGKEWDGADGFRRSLNASDAGRANVFGRTSRTSPEYRASVVFQEWCEAWAAESLRVLKPGGHLLAFGGTRTYHRMACAVEDAGFNVRDQLHWLYGSGFPKSRNLDGELSGWGTALKPANEPIVLARKPLVSTVAANVLEFGTGALNIDGCRIEGPKPDTTRGAGGQNGRYGPIGDQGRVVDDGRGRWPANVLLDEEAAAILDAQSGTLISGVYSGKRNVPKTKNTFGAFTLRDEDAATYGDSGGASRFFYTAKASRSEREEGLHGEPLRDFGQWSNGDQSVGTFQSPNTNRKARNHHPTVKPVDLMRWLVRLITPPGGTVLDPFTGSGTTGMAALAEGFNFVGIEREAEYITIARHRIATIDPMWVKEDLSA